MDIDQKILKHLPESFQVWQRIEREAERRAEQRFQEILNKQKETTGAMGKAPAAEVHSNVGVSG